MSAADTQESATKPFPGSKKDLAALGPGAARNKILREAVQLPAQDLCKFLVENQSSFLPDDLTGEGKFAYNLSMLGKDGLLEGLNKISDSKVRGVFYDALIHWLSSQPDAVGYRKVAEQIPAGDIRQGFLTNFIAHRLQANPDAIMMEMPGMRELSPNKQLTGWYNQLVADSFAKTPASDVPKVWDKLMSISDQPTRIIAAQHLFGSLYEHDSIAASEWLNALKESPDKQNAISYLVQALVAEGHLAEAEAWRSQLNQPQ